MNKLARVNIKGYKCQRCGHKWAPRREALPNICPKCKSKLWAKRK